MGENGNEEAVYILIECLSDKSNLVKNSASTALENLYEKDFVKDLLFEFFLGLAGDDSNDKNIIENFLCEQADEDLIDRLIQLLNNEKNKKAAQELLLEIFCKENNTVLNKLVVKWHESDDRKLKKSIKEHYVSWQERLSLMKMQKNLWSLCSHFLKTMFHWDMRQHKYSLI